MRKEIKSAKLLLEGSAEDRRWLQHKIDYPTLLETSASSSRLMSSYSRNVRHIMRLMDEDGWHP